MSDDWCGRDYRLQISYEARAERNLREEFHSMMRDPKLEVIPRNNRTLETETRLYITYASSSSRLYQWISELQDYPGILFGSLKDKSLVRKVDSDRKCSKRLDPWSAITLPIVTVLIAPSWASGDGFHLVEKSYREAFGATIRVWPIGLRISFFQM